MKNIRFFGYNDDLVHYKINGTEEEINAESVLFGLVSKDGMMTVAVRYSGEISAVWHITPIMWGEGEPFPDWPIYFGVEHDYSMYMLVEAPDDTKVIILGKN